MWLGEGSARCASALSGERDRASPGHCEPTIAERLHGAQRLSEARTRDPGRVVPPTGLLQGKPSRDRRTRPGCADPLVCRAARSGVRVRRHRGTRRVDIAEEDTLSHVFGYTVYNDFSAREIQSAEMTVGLGPAKGNDFLAAHVLGPVVVTVERVAKSLRPPDDRTRQRRDVDRRLDFGHARAFRADDRVRLPRRAGSGRRGVRLGRCRQWLGSRTGQVARGGRCRRIGGRRDRNTAQSRGRRSRAPARQARRSREPILAPGETISRADPISAIDIGGSQ
jgi:hypothetical protein